MKPLRKGQGGWTQIEVLLTGFLGLTLVLSGGYLFTSQVRGYQDIKDQAKLQASLKRALQGMTRQISNAVACLPNPLDHFGPEARRLTFAYVDVRGTFCDPDVIVILSFGTQSGAQEDKVVEDIQCVGGPSESRTIATAPRGGLDLSFRPEEQAGIHPRAIGESDMKPPPEGHSAGAPSASSGFALASVLTIMVVLSVLGSMVYRNVGTDITHSGRDLYPDPSKSEHGGGAENLAFKVWYPDDSTLRITGKADVDGATAQLDMVSNLKEVAVPF